MKLEELKPALYVRGLEGPDVVQIKSVEQFGTDAVFLQPGGELRADQDGSFSKHKSAVEIAPNRGLQVPAEVLKDYPDLMDV